MKNEENYKIDVLANGVESTHKIKGKETLQNLLSAFEQETLNVKEVKIYQKINGQYQLIKKEDLC